jgi:hypothetical protein
MDWPTMTDEEDAPEGYEKTEVSYFIERSKDTKIITLTVNCAISLDGEDYLSILEQFICDHREIQEELLTNEHSTEVETH